jgi:DNA invertase Pin-like site-specific DNA recombinase
MQSRSRMGAEDQAERLRSIAVKRGWMVVSVFTNRPTTVHKGLDRRVGEVALLDAIRSCGAIDKMLIWSVCLLGKSLADLVGFMEMCRVTGVAVYLHEQSVDSAMSNGLPIFDVVAMMALHVRQSRRDRILRSQAAARNLSIRFGRPPIAKAKVDKAGIALAVGKGVRQAARLAGISAASASRLKSTLDSVAVTA